MEKIQSSHFWKDPKFILALILTSFFFKGVFLTAITPIFQGVDEPDHYNTIQYVSEPRPITWEVAPREETERDTTHIRRYNYTEEIKETAKAIAYDEVFDDSYNTLSFVSGYEGKKESTINESNWNKYNEYSPPGIAVISLYHHLASFIEKFFEEQNIFFRYNLIRILSVFIGTLFLYFSYLVARNIGFSQKISLLLTAIVAFQPRFSIYSAIINYDNLLILAFIMFTLGGILMLKNNPDWKNILLVVISVLLGFFSKGTGAVLLVGAALLLAYFIYVKVKDKSLNIKLLTSFVFVCLTICATFFLVVFLKKYFSAEASETGLFDSLGKYLSKNFTLGKFHLSSKAYWGTLGWTDSWFIPYVVYMIWAIQTVAAAGVAFFLFSKKKIDYLPEKKYIIFFLGMLLLLQVAIRLVDWLFFYTTGKIVTGVPGRYFIPNLTAHIILVFTGLGAILKNNERFEKSLKIGLIIMVFFMLYIIFDMIVYRYYL